MKLFDKWYMPDNEKHLQEWMTNVHKIVDGRLTYQYHKYEKAMQFTQNRRRAIDIGAHIGLWSFWMARDFEYVYAFEPMPDHIECWQKNMLKIPNAILCQKALGSTYGNVMMSTRTEDSTGDTGIEEEGDVRVEMQPLDTMNLEDIDFIKIDCEGYEHQVLMGALETIRRCRPVIVVEQKGTMGEKYGSRPQAAVRFLEKLGANLKAELSGDYIMSWDN